MKLKPKSPEPPSPSPSLDLSLDVSWAQPETPQPSPLLSPRSPSLDSPTGPETGTGGEGMSIFPASLLLPPESKIQESMAQQWEKHAQAYRAFTQRMDSEYRESLRRVETRGIDGTTTTEVVSPNQEPRYRDPEHPIRMGASLLEGPSRSTHPFLVRTLEPITGWEPLPPSHNPGEWSHIRDPKEADLMLNRLESRMLYEALQPQTWNLWAVPVASYERQSPLTWLHVRVQEPVILRENQSILIGSLKGEALGSVLIRVPPIKCRSAAVASLVMKNTPLYLASPLK